MVNEEEITEDFTKGIDIVPGREKSKRLAPYCREIESIIALARYPPIPSIFV